jgi:hypothetical protein
VLLKKKNNRMLPHLNLVFIGSFRDKKYPISNIINQLNGEIRNRNALDKIKNID